MNPDDQLYYHLSTRCWGLRGSAPLVRELVVVETYVELKLNGVRYPALGFFPGTSF
jgi:hypothetical protein